MTGFGFDPTTSEGGPDGPPFARYEIVVRPSGDRAETETLAEAALAARTLLREARDAGCGDPRASVYRDGLLIRPDLRASEVEL